MEPTILELGRGPTIAGSRITVFDVLAETQAGATPAQVAEWFQLSIEQVEAALRYIEEHRERILDDYRKIKERHARGNPPEIQAKLDAIHAKYAPIWAELRRRAQSEKNGEAKGSAEQ
jgi:uncharacterized protein (DUF433 family)